MVERQLCKLDVRGSNPLASSLRRATKFVRAAALSEGRPQRHGTSRRELQPGKPRLTPCRRSANGTLGHLLSFSDELTNPGGGICRGGFLEGIFPPPFASFFGVKSGNFTTNIFFSFDFLSAICVGAPFVAGSAMLPSRAKQQPVPTFYTDAGRISIAERGSRVNSSSPIPDRDSPRVVPGL